MTNEEDAWGSVKRQCTPLNHSLKACKSVAYREKASKETRNQPKQSVSAKRTIVSPRPNNKGRAAYIAPVENPIGKNKAIFQYAKTISIAPNRCNSHKTKAPIPIKQWRDNPESKLIRQTVNSHPQGWIYGSTQVNEYKSPRTNYTYGTLRKRRP